MENKKKTKLQLITQSRVFWMILSFLGALILWMYVTTTEGVEVETTLSGIRIEFLGADALRESSGLIVTEQDRSALNLTLRSTRRVLRQLNSSNVTAIINLNRVTGDGRYTVAYDISYPSGVSADEVTVVRASADVINFYVDRQLRLTIPVEGEFTGRTEEGYMAEEDLIFDPLAVTISGPKTAVDQVARAYVAITRTDVDKTLQYSTTYELQDADGNTVDDSRITLETPEVNVTLNVLSIRQVPLDVNIINSADATRDANTSIRIEPSYIVLSGDASAVDSTSKLVLGTIDLGSFVSEYAATYTIVPPNDTENLTGVNEASVTVTIIGVASRTFNIGHENISCVNVPEGFREEIITQSLPVTIRATEEVLSAIDINNLRAVADLADVGTNASGVITPTVRIYVDGFPTASVIGSDYRIYVTLTEIEDGDG